MLCIWAAKSTCSSSRRWVIRLRLIWECWGACLESTHRWGSFKASHSSITLASAKIDESKMEIFAISRSTLPSISTSQPTTLYSPETQIHHLLVVIIFIWMRSKKLRSDHCRTSSKEGCGRSLHRIPMLVSVICTSSGKTHPGISFYGSGSVLGTVRKWCCRSGIGRWCIVSSTVTLRCDCTRTRSIISLSMLTCGIEDRSVRERIEPYSHSSIYIQFYTIKNKT